MIDQRSEHMQINCLEGIFLMAPITILEVVRVDE